MPVYDCGSPDCVECKKAFGPGRSAAIASYRDRIVTSFDYPPIPIRSIDWSAVLDGYEPGDPVGRGETPEAAVADLLDQVSAA